MSSKAQIKASNKYNRENSKGYYIRFNHKTDAAIIMKLDREENKTGYIKHLIQMDMFREKLQNGVDI